MGQGSETSPLPRPALVQKLLGGATTGLSGPSEVVGAAGTSKDRVKQAISKPSVTAFAWSDLPSHSHRMVEESNPYSQAAQSNALLWGDFSALSHAHVGSVPP